MFDLINLFIALFSLYLAIFTYIQHHETSYPRISIKNLCKYRKSNIIDRCLVYEKETRRVYLLAKFNVTNLSPVAGKVYHFVLKYRLTKNIKSLTKQELKLLPEDFNKFITLFSKNTSEILDVGVKSEPFEDKTITIIFKMPYERSVFFRKKRFKLLCYYLGNKKIKSKTKFSLSFKHYLDNKNIKEMLNGLKTQQEEDFKLFIKQNKIALDQFKKSLSHLKKEN